MATTSHLLGALTWAYEFEDQEWFAGFRELASNGVDKPVMNIFRMFGMMHGKRVLVEGNPYPAKKVIEQGIRNSPDINAMACVKLKSSFGRRMLRLRQSTVEPVFGTLINFNNMRKVFTRGKDCAHKSMLMSAIAYNLKKYIKYFPKKVNLMVQAVKVQIKNPANLLFLPKFSFCN